MCKTKLYGLTVFVLFFATVSAAAENFMFKYETGNTYRILSTVDEQVFINGVKSFNSVIVNRISVIEKKAYPDGSTDIEATFMTSENSAPEGQSPRYMWGEEYFSAFNRNKLGVYTIGEDAFMPVVRNVPVFTGKDVQVGETWTAAGEEAHDLRVNFSLQKPFKVPFSATYKYEGKEETEGKTFHIISVKYTLFYEIPAGYAKKTNDRPVPVSFMGYSEQKLYWDNERGFLDHYSEHFRIVMETDTGNKLEFKGTAQAQVNDLKPLSQTGTLERIKQQIKELGIENADAGIAEKGITISLENIQFEAESAALKAEELAKLRKIGEILKDFPQNDLLISGHTALAGTAKGRQKLSERRASAVADYLAELGVKRHEQLFTKGFGAEKPIAPNTTEKGKSRNRRVEITILEK